MRILFVRFSALGDVTLVTGVCSLVKKKFPEAQIDFLTKPELVPLLECCPFVDQVLSWSHRSRSSKESSQTSQSYFNFIKNLDNYNYVFDMHNKIRSRVLQFRFLSKYFCYKKKSLQRRARVLKLIKSKSFDHVIQRYAKPVCKALDLKMPLLEDLRPCLQASSFIKDSLTSALPKKFVVIHPFASHKTKEWPHERVYELCKKINAHGLHAVIVGQGDLDSDLEVKFSSEKKIINLANQTSLKELIYVLSQAQVVVSTDSGPLHMAAALERPVVTLLGCTVKEFGFVPEFENTSLIEVKGLNCRPCHVHGQNNCPERHFRCMRDISVEEVAREVIRFS